MQEQTIPESEINFYPGLKEFLSLMQVRSEEGEYASHGDGKDIEPEGEKQECYCANCGKGMPFGLFCSMSCEKEVYGV